MNNDDICRNCPLRQTYQVDEDDMEIHMEDYEHEDKTLQCSNCPFKKNKNHAVLVIPISMN